MPKRPGHQPRHRARRPWPVATVYHIAGYTLAGFPYPVQEAWLMTGQEFERKFGADAGEE